MKRAPFDVTRLGERKSFKRKDETVLECKCGSSYIQLFRAYDIVSGKAVTVPRCAWCGGQSFAEGMRKGQP